MTYPVVKRAMDVLVAGAGLVLLSPLLLALGALVRASIGSPVLFVQTRPGLHGRPFRMYKLRTMRDGYDAAGRPLPDAERQANPNAQ